MTLPKPELADRATASVLIAAFASEQVRTAHAAWRAAADALTLGIDDVIVNTTEDGDPYANAPEDSTKELAENLQPKERAARRQLAEAVAHELDHRKQSAQRHPDNYRGAGALGGSGTYTNIGSPGDSGGVWVWSVGCCRWLPADPAGR
jgi:hypothetical protein